MTADNNKENNRAAVVTGGSQGIGRAVVLRLVKMGYDIYFCHLDPDDGEAEKTCSMVKEMGGKAQAHRLDVSDKEAVKEYFSQVLEQAGRIDVLVNNAGITKDGLIMRMKEADWDAVLSVNLSGAFFCLQEAARAMLRQKSGCVVNISSVVGVMGNAGQANYSAAKGGLVALTKTAAKELAGKGIRVNAVAPGFIETQMTAVLPEKVLQAMVDATLLGRVGKPEDIAGAVAYLASDDGAFVTGQVLHVNGGLYI